MLAVGILGGLVSVWACFAALSLDLASETLDLLEPSVELGILLMAALWLLIGVLSGFVCSSIAGTSRAAIVASTFVGCLGLFTVLVLGLGVDLESGFLLAVPTFGALASGLCLGGPVATLSLLRRRHRRSSLRGSHLQTLSLRHLLAHGIVVAAVALGTVLGWIGFQPKPYLRLSEASIHRRLLKETPLGSSEATITGAFTGQGWEGDLECNFVGECGDYPFGIEDAPAARRYVRRFLGDYQGWPWAVHVTALFYFDSDDRLVHLAIWKAVDAL